MKWFKKKETKVVVEKKGNFKKCPKCGGEIPAKEGVIRISCPSCGELVNLRKI